MGRRMTTAADQPMSPRSASDRPARSTRIRSWRLVAAAMAVWLLALIVACAAAISLMIGIERQAGEGMRADIGADHAQEVHIAVLVIRHDQQALAFSGPSQALVTQLEAGYQDMLGRIDELARQPVDADLAAEVANLRPMALEYYARFRPAIDAYGRDPAAFEARSDRGLVDLDAIERKADLLAHAMEARAVGAIGDAQRGALGATLILLVVVLAVVAVSLALALAAARTIRHIEHLDLLQDATMARLREALRTKTEFLAEVSHELRTPLTVLRGNAEVGLAAGACERRHEPVLKEIVEESVRMSRLVEGLLLLARFDAGPAPLEFRMVDVEPWLADVAARGEMLARERSRRLVVSLKVAGQARMDPERLGEAVMVVIDNATRYTPESVPIRLRGRTTRSSLVLDVIDQGPGIPADVLPVVFERFRQGSRDVRRPSGGAGLGLSIARAIMDAHGGSIQAVSREGSGTRMRLVLPLPPEGGSPLEADYEGEASSLAPVRNR